MRTTFTDSQLRFGFFFIASLIFAISNLSFANTGNRGTGNPDVTVVSPQLSSGLASSPLIAGATDQAIFGFELDKASGGTNDARIIKVLFDQDPTARFSNVRIYRSTDNVFDGVALETQVFVGTLSNAPNSVTFKDAVDPTLNPVTTFGGSTGAVQRFFFVVVDVLSTVNTSTNAVTASLTNADVTVSNNSVTGSVTGSVYAFAPITATFSQQTGGVSTTLTTGDTQKAIIGFSLASNASQTLTGATFTLSATAASLGLTNIELFQSASATYNGTGTAIATVGNTKLVVSGSTVTVSSISASTSNYYFLRVDAPAAATFDVELTSATVSPGITAGLPFSNTGIVVSALTAAYTVLTAAPVLANASNIVSGSATQAIAGFSVSSNGTQTISVVNFGVTSSTSFSHFYLYRNTTAGTLTGATILANSTSSSNFTALTDNVTSGTTNYYYLVADVSTTATGSSTITIDESAVTITGVANTFSVNNSYNFVPSSATVFSTNNGENTTGIVYANYHNNLNSSGLTTGNTTKIYSFKIKDDNVDGFDTKIDALNFSLTNFANVNAIALFDGSTNIGELTVSSGTINFTGLNYTIPSNTTKTIDIGVTFKSSSGAAIVTDNQTLDISLQSASALTSTTLSNLATYTAGSVASATGATKNKITVTATEMKYSSVSVSVTPNANFGFTVTAIDADGNKDVDDTNTVTISNDATSTGAGTISASDAGGLTRSFSSGVVSWSQVQETLAGSYNIKASSSGLTDKLQNIPVASLGVALTVMTPNLPAPSLCIVGAGNFYTTLTPLILLESDPSDFTPGTNLSYLLLLPNGFEFDTTTPGATSFTASKNVTFVSGITFTGTTIAKFTYTVVGTNQTDQITISGLKVKNVSAVSTQSILRSGSGVMAGNDETTIQGTLTFGASPVANFTVQESPNQTPITPTSTNFSTSSAPIILNPSIAGSPTTLGVFTGQGISYNFIGTPVNKNRFLFNPNTLAANTYHIDYNYSDPTNGCISKASQDFNVYSSAINGLQNQYCINDNTPQSLSVNPVFMPSGYSFANYSITFPSYKNITNFVNNGSSITITVPNHGLSTGSLQQIYVGGGFTGPGASIYGYIYGSYLISNVTANTFDVSITVFGNWYGYGNLYLVQPTVTGVANFSSFLRITAAGHGLQNGAKIEVSQLNGLSIDGGATFGFSGWFTVSNSTLNTFDIVLPATATGSYSGGAYINIFSYEISSFYPTIASSLNSQFSLAGGSYYYVGFMVRPSPCSGAACKEFIWNDQYVQLNALPIVDFTGLGKDYCVNNSAPVALTGNNTDGVFSASPNFGLTDGGIGNNTGSFVASSTGIITEIPIGITYTFTDANSCTNSVTKNTTVHALPTVNAGPDQPLCNGSSVQIGASLFSPTASGHAPFGYSWDNGGSLDVFTNPKPNASPVSNTTYTVTVTDVFGCINSDAMIVTVTPQAVAVLGSGAPICSSSVSIDLNTLGANILGSATSGIWSAPLGDGTFQTSSSIANSSFGTASKYVIGSNDIASQSVKLVLTTDDPTGPCPAASNFVTITINPVATANPGTYAQICANNAINLNGTVTGGSPSGTWSTNGQGSFTSPSFANTTNALSTPYFPSANELTSGAVITMTLTTADPDGAGPCVADAKPATITIMKRPAVNAGVDLPICGIIGTTAQNAPLNGSIVNSSATAVTWSIIRGGGTFSPDAFTANAVYIPSTTESTIGGIADLLLTSDDPTGGVCPVGTDAMSIIINAQPAPPIINAPKEYCVTEAILDLNGAGTSMKWYDAALVQKGTGSSFATGVIPNAEKIVSFFATQTSAQGCESTTTPVNINVHPLPQPSFTAVQQCLGTPSQFTDGSTISTALFADNIQTWLYRFGDGDNLDPNPDVAIPTGTHKGKTTGTFANPFHQYDAIGIYGVQLHLTSNIGCTNNIAQPFEIGPVPKADFKFDNICNADLTDFAYTGTAKPVITTWDWDFGDASTGPNIFNPQHQYNGVNNYTVKLTVTTNFNCTDNISKVVNILPYVTSFPYIEDFDMAGHGWFTEGLGFNELTSWQVASPAGTNINVASTGTNAWITRVNSSMPYNNNERSVVNGPCINVANLDRPALSLDYWDDTDKGNDGAYVEVSADGGKNWSVLGNLNQGLRWYDKALVLGLTTQNGIGQNIGQVGWSGPTSGWTTGKFSLDNFKTETKLRVRLVFGSNSDNPTGTTLDGFALDHFKLSSRNRVVLVENFTNSTETADNTAFNNFLQPLTNNELVKMQYHTGLKGTDAIYDENRTDPNARVGFYGITNSAQLIPRGYLDGFSGGDLTSAWKDNYFTLHSLEDAPFNIQINTIPSNDPGSLKISVSYTVLEDIPKGKRPALQVVIVEKTVGPNEYVVRKMLPSAVGTSLASPLLTNATATLPFTWQVDNAGIDVTNLAIVAFIQDMDTQEVYQTAIDLNPADLPASVTGLEPAFANQIKVYPTPADESINIELPESVREKTPVKLFDVNGHEVVNTVLKAGEQRKVLSTRDFASGVYILQIEKGNEILRKKVMVMH